MSKGIMVIEERGDRRYGRMVTADSRKCQGRSPSGTSCHLPHQREASETDRILALEDVEILTAVNQMRKEQRRRDAVEAQKRREAMRKNKRRAAICLAIDIFACISCMVVFTMTLMTQDKLITLGMIAMFAAYALFKKKLEGK